MVGFGFGDAVEVDASIAGSQIFPDDLKGRMAISMSQTRDGAEQKVERRTERSERFGQINGRQTRAMGSNADFPE
jgi:hypothetical protein